MRKVFYFFYKSGRNGLPHITNVSSGKKNPSNKSTKTRCSAHVQSLSAAHIAILIIPVVRHGMNIQQQTVNYLPTDKETCSAAEKAFTSLALRWE